MFLAAAHIGASPAVPARSCAADSSRRHDARRANAFAARRRALRHGMTIPGSRPGAIRLRSRFIPDGRPARVGLVRHGCTSSFRTNPIARMERKAARSRRRNQWRSEYPGRSAIHVCNTMRCVSVFFHSLVPVSDTSDPLKRLPGRQHPRSRSRPIQPCKERTMLHAARPRGHVPGCGQPSHPVRKRERFYIETRRRTNRHRRAGSAWDGQSPYNRLTAGGAPRPDACARPCPLPRLATARPEPALAAWSRLPSLRTRVVLQYRPRPPSIATRGVTRGARVAQHDAAGRLARRGAVPLGHRANTLAFGHGTPYVRTASPPRIRHAPNRSRQPRRRTACLC